MECIERKLLDLLSAEIQAGRIHLPSLPEVALKVREAVEKEEISAAKLATLIAEDAALAARLLQVANSPLYRGRSEITSLQMAITRMGYNTVRTLLISLAMKQVFKPTSALLERHFRVIWHSSVEVAAISRALASLSPHLNAEEAMLAGLIHQIGKLPILTLAERNPILRNNPTELERVLDALHPEVGRLILNAWQFPKALCQVVTEYRNFQRQPEGGGADYVDLVQVAHLQYLISRDEALPVDPAQVGAFARLGLAPNIEVVELEDLDLTKQLLA
ncbi:MAG: HDOD domain-containing protein [Methylohalobius sp.]|nr:HDOD domain-containing protein [Methylohalobius sp.]